MKQGFIIILFSLIFLPEKIVAQRVETDENLKKYFSYQPPKRRFKFFKKKHLEKTINAFVPSGLDTNAVYLTTDYIEGEKRNEYGYVRFFSNGVVFMSYDYRGKLSEAELNDLSYGRWGAYKIMDANELIMEIYINESMTHFHYCSAKIAGDVIKLYKVKMGKRLEGAVEKIYFEWKKKPMLFKDYQTRWRDCR